MLARLLDRIAPPRREKPAQLELAAAVLLVEAARMDEAVEATERARILALVRHRFALSQADADALVEQALSVTEGAAPWQTYTAILKDRLSYEERVRLIEMLWEVVYADGVLHDLESSLLRRVAGLLYVSDHDRGAARLRVMKKLGLGQDPER
jgi:uncharacterized tellurite resistance protein B-like protein